MQKSSTLLISPSVPLWEYQERILIDQKFHTGIMLYLKHWPGKIQLAMRKVVVESAPPFGAVEYKPHKSAFEIIHLADAEQLSQRHLVGVDLVMASLDSHLDLHVPALCHLLNIPCIAVIEYTLRTRLQMLLQSGVSHLQRLKTFVWTLRNEMQIRKAISKCASVQANGYPAYKAYGHRADSLLYLDNRISRDICTTKTALQQRLQHLVHNAPLRLAFSGRLIKAKGADALIDVAGHLRDAGIAFELHIFGSGDQERPMQLRTQKLGLQSQITFHGAVDFDTELVPYIREQIDLFVCCHRQGDPSCTYLETFGCGVPVVGYANEAFAGLLENYSVGWSAPMNDAKALAHIITKLNNDRALLASYAYQALDLAKQNLFEDIFKARMEHCKRTLDRTQSHQPG